MILKTPREIELMLEAGRINNACHLEIRRQIRPGVSTGELDSVAEKFLESAGAKPAFKGYMGYPAVINASVNEEVVHGIPRKDRKLREGDIISIDLGCIWQGYYADSAYTWPVGEIPESAKKLMRVTRECLYRAVRLSVAGNRIGDVSSAVQQHAEANGYSVVRDLVGHGIGRRMHEDPKVPNFGNAGTGQKIRPGMVIAIEPMVNSGKYQVEILEDDWTVVALDRKPSAHYEHTVAVTQDGPRILTALQENDELEEELNSYFAEMSRKEG